MCLSNWKAHCLALQCISKATCLQCESINASRSMLVGSMRVDQCESINASRFNASRFNVCHHVRRMVDSISSITTIAFVSYSEAPLSCMDSQPNVNAHVGTCIHDIHYHFAKRRRHIHMFINIRLGRQILPHTMPGVGFVWPGRQIFFTHPASHRFVLLGRQIVHTQCPGMSLSGQADKSSSHTPLHIGLSGWTDKSSTHNVRG